MAHQILMDQPIEKPFLWYTLVPLPNVRLNFQGAVTIFAYIFCLLKMTTSQILFLVFSPTLTGDCSNIKCLILFYNIMY